MAYRYGQDAKAVSGAVREGVKQVYYVADGADGVRGWRVSACIFPRQQPVNSMSIAMYSLLCVLEAQVCVINKYAS